MENDSFKNQFKQNIQTTLAREQVTTKSADSKLPLAIALALAAVLIVETIALMVFIINYIPSSVSEPSYSDEGSEYLAGSYLYDENSDLYAINVECTSESGAVFSFSINNQYNELTQDSSDTNGTYSISHSKLILLSEPRSNGEERVLYFDGFSLADGTTFYDCQDKDIEENL